MPRESGRGARLFILNCSLVDRFFRQFNGHTQVNATDLRSLRYPDRAVLERLGMVYEGRTLSQQDIDTIVEEEICHIWRTTTTRLTPQRKIDEALEILKALGMPRGQQNDRSALTLLALVDLKPPGVWSRLERPLMGITPIMGYAREYYGQGVRAQHAGNLPAPDDAPVCGGRHRPLQPGRSRSAPSTVRMPVIR